MAQEEVKTAVQKGHRVLTAVVRPQTARCALIGMISMEKADSRN